MCKLACAALLLTFSVAQSAANAQNIASIGCPTPAPLTGAPFVSEVTVSVGTSPLGAYAINVIYDKTVVTIASVAGGTTAEFSGAPFANSADFASGHTPISAGNLSSLTSPTGLVSVARITFNAEGPPGSSSALALEITTLVDTNGDPIAADTQGCTVEIAGMTPTPSPTQATVTPTAPETSTATPSATAAIPTPTETVAGTSSPSPSGTPTPPASPTPTPPSCTGDCNGDDEVTVDELVRGVNSALDIHQIGACPGFGGGEGGTVSVGEIVSALDAALNSCLDLSGTA